MILDDRLNFGELALGGGTFVGISVGTFPNTVDLGQRTDLLDCDGLFLELKVTEAATISVGVPYVNIGLVVADDATFTVNPTTIVMTGGGGNVVSIATFFAAGIAPAMVAGQITLNKTIFLPLPKLSALVYGSGSIELGNPPNYLQRYLGVVMWQPKAPAAQFTLGKMTARIVKDPASRHKTFTGVPGAV